LVGLWFTIFTNHEDEELLSSIGLKKAYQSEEIWLLERVALKRHNQK